MTPILHKNLRHHKRFSPLEIFMDFLQGDRSTRICHFLYADQKEKNSLQNKSGVKSWEKAMLDTGNYYVFNNEAELIGRVAPEIAEVTAYQPRFIELGVGGRKPVENKTLALLQALKPQFFVANDISDQSVIDVKRFLNESLPQIHVETCNADFLDTSSAIFEKAGGNVFLAGITVGNITFYDGRPAVNETAEYLQTIGSLLGEDGNLIITQDTNKDEQSLLDAYNAPHLRTFFTDLMPRMESLLDVIGFDYSALRYEPVWHKESNLLSITFLNTKDQTIYIQGKKQSLPTGRRLYIGNCYKFSKTEFLHIARIAGFEAVKTWMDRDERVALHVLRKKK